MKIDKEKRIVLLKERGEDVSDIAIDESITDESITESEMI